MKAKKVIYLDNAASTPLDRKVAEEMNRAAKLYGNPSSYNDCGREAREYIERARLKVARFLGAHSDEIIFTASGTEANNLATQGVARGLLHYRTTALRAKNRPHIITTKIEHPSVLEPIKWLERNGFDVSYLSVDKQGFVNLEELQKSLQPATVLVSVMYANNEIGTIQPIAKIGKIISDFRERNIDIPARPAGGSKFRNIQYEKFPIFHTDACQATEYLDINVNHLGVDLLTFNGTKIYGPRGIGVLYVRRGVGISPIITGGEQELGLRAGTENVPAIGGLAVALDKASKNIPTFSRMSEYPKLARRVAGLEGKRLADLRDYFIEEIKELLPDVVINGALGDKRLPNNINISVPYISSEVLLLELDKYGICAGSGSACTSHSVEPSHVLKAIEVVKAIEVEPRYINGALRFSMGRQTTKGDIDYVLKVLPKVVRELKKRYKSAR